MSAAWVESLLGLRFVDGINEQADRAEVVFVRREHDAGERGEQRLEAPSTTSNVAPLDQSQVRRAIHWPFQIGQRLNTLLTRYLRS